MICILDLEVQMKIKTIVLLFGVMFLISGCSVTYNLEIAENTFNESFTINANIDNVYPTKDDLYNAYLEEYPVFIDQEFMYYDPYNRNEDYDYFDKSFQETTNGYLFNYKYNQFEISIQFLCLIFENISDILILWKKKDINI